MTNKYPPLRVIPILALFVGVWLLMRYLFPLFAPFLLGLALAALAEPIVKFLGQVLRLPRKGASFLAVTALLGAVAALAAALVSLVLSKAADLAKVAADAARQLGQVEEQLIALTAHAPAGLAEPLGNAARNLFQEDSLMSHGTKAALDVAGKAAGGLPALLMLLGTAVLAGYMISAQWPALRAKAGAVPLWQKQLRPALHRLKASAGCWLRAQLKLSGVIFAIVLVGYLLLGVEKVLPLALLTAAVDAVPLLGTGTVLIPWALTSFLGGNAVRAVGLLGIYVTAVLTRTSLEPRLVGKQLGLNPLTALASLYIGYRLWGFGGMIAAPILTVTARELARGD